MPQILRYSDFKGRTDLLGRKVRIRINEINNANKEPGWSVGRITKVTDDSFYVTSFPTLFTLRCLFICSGTIELLDEEPTKDTRTKITWENATMDSLVNCPYGGKMTVRQFAKREAEMHDVPLIQTLTRQQAEEKLKEFGCEVMITE